LALRLADDDTSIEPTSTASPRASDKSGAQALPAIGVAFGLGERWVIGAALGQSIYQRKYTIPQFGQRPEDVERFFPTRYGGLEASSENIAFVVGGAVRAGDWLALAASAGFESAKLETTRMIWAGFSGREPVGDPAKDLILVLRGNRRFIPRAAIGAFIAPVDVPIEMAASISVRPPTTLEGDAALRSTTSDGAPPAFTAAQTATLDRPGIAIGGAGIRYLGSRIVIELGAQVTRYWRRLAARSWRLSPLTVTDESGAEGALTRVETLIATRPHFRLSGALDVAVIDGFLWLTAGYAYQSAAVADADRGPLLSAPPLHIAALGAEAVWANFVVTLGVSRAFAPRRTVTATTSVTLVNPYGDGAGTGPAGTGQYTYSADRGALTVEYAF